MTKIAATWVTIVLLGLISQSPACFGAVSKSADFETNAELNESQRILLANQHLASASTTQSLLQTREQVIANKNAQATDKSVAVSRSLSAIPMASLAAHSYYHSFSIYDVHTYLLEDRNHDGFYRSFSLDIDADVAGAIDGERVAVYAELYLSRNGGNWLHYYTTNIFYLQGQSSNDSYQVSTSLESGYPTDHYDVLIDLYEVGYSDIVATVSSDDLNSLYALPLQSRDRDNDNGGTIIAVSAGSLSMAFVLLLFGCVWLRRRLRLGRQIKRSCWREE